MEKYCMNICNYHSGILEAYSDESPGDDDYVDDNQYFDIDISLPFSPTASIPASNEDDTEDKFEFDFSVSNANPQNLSLCFSPAKNLFYQGQLLHLQLIPPPLDDITSPQFSSNVPEVEIQLTHLLRTGAKLNISFSGFRESAKFGRDFWSPCGEYGTSMDSTVPKQNRLPTLKLKVMEVPLVSLFSRDNSKGFKRDVNNHGFQKKSEDSDDGEGQTYKSINRNKKRAKEIVMKYVNKTKPLFVKISLMYDEKIRSRDMENPRVRNGWENGGCEDSEKSEKHIRLFYFCGNQKIVYNHLGKKKLQPSDHMQQKLSNYNMISEKTLVEMQSSIEEAIAHCKQSNSIDDTSNCANSRCWAKSQQGFNRG